MNRKGGFPLKQERSSVRQIVASLRSAGVGVPVVERHETERLGEPLETDDSYRQRGPLRGQ